MNKEKLNAIHVNYEAQARFYCEKMGLDPDQKFHVPGPKPKIAGVPAPVVKVYRWQMVAEELYDLSVRIVALQEGKKPVPKLVTQ